MDRFIKKMFIIALRRIFELKIVQNKYSPYHFVLITQESCEGLHRYWVLCLNLCCEVGGIRLRVAYHYKSWDLTSNDDRDVEVEKLLLQFPRKIRLIHSVLRFMNGQSRLN